MPPDGSLGSVRSPTGRAARPTRLPKGTHGGRFRARCTPTLLPSEGARRSTDSTWRRRASRRIRPDAADETRRWIPSRKACAKSDVGKVWADLNTFKVRVAEEYAKQAHLHDFEAKMDARFDKVDAKLERILNGRKGG